MRYARRAAALLAVILLAAVLCSCGGSDYDTDWIVGKTSAQIEERYGPFYQCGMPAGADGLYRNCRCSLVITPRRAGFLGTSPAEVLAISFDGNGVAISTEVTVGDWGG